MSKYLLFLLFFFSCLLLDSFFSIFSSSSFWGLVSNIFSSSSFWGLVSNIFSSSFWGLVLNIFSSSFWGLCQHFFVSSLLLVCGVDFFFSVIISFLAGVAQFFLVFFFGVEVLHFTFSLSHLKQRSPKIDFHNFLPFLVVYSTVDNPSSNQSMSFFFFLQRHGKPLHTKMCIMLYNHNTNTQARLCCSDMNGLLISDFSSLK